MWLPSKIIRLAEKDIEDLNQIIPKCNKDLLNQIINEILKFANFNEINTITTIC